MNGDLPIQFFMLVQLAEDEMQMLFNCGDAKSKSGIGYYYDVIEEFDKGWKKLNRTLPKGEYEQYREAFCNAADEIESEVNEIRQYFVGRSEAMFEGGTTLLAHLIMSKFLLKSADYIFNDMYPDNHSRWCKRILQSIDVFAKLFTVRSKGKGDVVAPDMEIVKKFNDKLIAISREV